MKLLDQTLNAEAGLLMTGLAGLACLVLVAYRAGPELVCEQGLWELESPLCKDTQAYTAWRDEQRTMAQEMAQRQNEIREQYDAVREVCRQTAALFEQSSQVAGRGVESLMQAPPWPDDSLGKATSPPRLRDGPLVLDDLAPVREHQDELVFTEGSSPHPIVAQLGSTDLLCAVRADLFAARSEAVAYNADSWALRREALQAALTQLMQPLEALSDSDASFEAFKAALVAARAGYGQALREPVLGFWGEAIRQMQEKAQSPHTALNEAMVRRAWAQALDLERRREPPAPPTAPHPPGKARNAHFPAALKR